MNAAVGLMDGLGLDGDWCIRVIPRQYIPVRNSQDENLNTAGALHTVLHSIVFQSRSGSLKASLTFTLGKRDV